MYTFSSSTPFKKSSVYIHLVKRPTKQDAVDRMVQIEVKVAKVEDHQNQLSLLRKPSPYKFGLELLNAFIIHVLYLVQPSRINF
jgi:hypothetical protein